MFNPRTATPLLALILTLLFHAPLQASGEVNIYSYRKPALIQPMFDQFTTETGIQVNAVYARTGMLEKLQSEGENSPADLVLTTDIGRLSDLKNAALTQAVESDILSANIPPSMRDSENHWFGLTARARIIVTSIDRVQPDTITTYRQLADPAFKGKICTRSAKHPYMVALTASMIEHHGAAAAEQWLAGVKANLARPPQGNDRGQVKAIAEGVCDIAVINHYYLYNMISDPKQKPWADSVAVVFPNQNDHGTHMNISGMALTRHAPNRQNAVALMEFLSSDPIQLMYARINGEYAVKPEVPLASAVKKWGKFKQDNIALQAVASHRAQAAKMADRVDYDG